MAAALHCVDHLTQIPTAEFQGVQRLNKKHALEPFAAQVLQAGGARERNHAGDIRRRQSDGAQILRIEGKHQGAVPAGGVA